MHVCEPCEALSNLLVSHLRIHKELNKHKSSPAGVNIYFRRDNFMIFSQKLFLRGGTSKVVLYHITYVVMYWGGTNRILTRIRGAVVSPWYVRLLEEGTQHPADSKPRP